MMYLKNSFPLKKSCVELIFFFFFKTQTLNIVLILFVANHEIDDLDIPQTILDVLAHC